MRKTLVVAALVAAGCGLAACNNDTPTSRVGSGAGQTDNAGAPSGRVTTQGEAQQSGAN
ncbi:hypothetical protein [Aureimonas psammosilenae]|jgi:predicted small secreted protein|uniref:hypothetical protein n=1 Tax=Aureimonas psammosilenae TaxID=2495496 RepID=UPI0018698426|nr:hypothetical protein [Aureimonas psammosilenae]